LYLPPLHPPDPEFFCFLVPPGEGSPPPTVSVLHLQGFFEKCQRSTPLTFLPRDPENAPQSRSSPSFSDSLPGPLCLSSVPPSESPPFGMGFLRETCHRAEDVHCLEEWHPWEVFLAPPPQIPRSIHPLRAVVWERTTTLRWPYWTSKISVL